MHLDDPFSTQFSLSREYLAECFDQSLPHGKNAKPNFLMPVLLIIMGVGLLVATEQLKFVGSLLVAMAALELVHIRYRRTWWLTRQMWGNTANSLVKLTIDNTGVSAQNISTKTELLWTDVARVIETDLGLILVAKNGGQQYLSKALFSTELINEIITGNNN